MNDKIHQVSILLRDIKRDAVRIKFYTSQIKSILVSDENEENKIKVITDLTEKMEKLIKDYE